MSQIQQYTYTPGRPNLPAVIIRLAQKVQAADAAEGIYRPWDDCIARAKENWRHVRDMYIGVAK